MNKRILAGVALLLMTTTANAKTIKTMVEIVPPPPPISNVTASAKDLSFRDNCALIALNHVMTDTVSGCEQKEIVAAAWAMADKMEAERCRRSGVFKHETH